MTVRRPAPRASVLLLTGCLLLATAGCTGADSHSAQSRAPASVSPTASTHQPATPSQTPTDTESRSVILAYDGMWADVVEAGRTADYGAPSLAVHTVDPATGQLRRTLLALHQMGWVAKGSVVPHPTIVSMSPPNEPVHAEIVDCLDETDWLTYHADTGELTDDKPGQRHQVTAVMRRSADGWKVESFTIASGGSC